jgi:hypothetical protein
VCYWQIVHVVAAGLKSLLWIYHPDFDNHQVAQTSHFCNVKQGFFGNWNQPSDGKIVCPGPGFNAPCGMVHGTSNKAGPDLRRRYRWPWFMLAALCAAIALAILWLSVEIERTRRIRDLNAPVAPNHP